MIAYGQSQGKGGESTVTMNERRAEIMRILVARRATTMPVLARTFGVTTRTIQNDILALTVDYPLETKQGNGGCVKVERNRGGRCYPIGYYNICLLSQLMESATEQQAEVLREMLVEYGSPKYRQMYEEDRNVRNITRVSH